ncbi:MAG: transferrin-binding protein-like solute binding protein, partial [Cardiobacterium hominis]
EQYLRTETGTMSARADFAKGTLDLSVKTPSHSGSITEAHINGNGFFGADEKKTVIGGNFAGPLAEEIFGSYSHIDQDGSTVWGAFGGKKQ